jgi:gas vesicle protein
MTEREDYMKFLPAGLVAIVLGAAAVLLLRRPRKPRSFREDPIGALKDRSEIVAGKAQEATEEALARIQETIDEIHKRLPDLNRKQFDKRRKQLNQRLAALGEQLQDLLKELRANSVLSR